MLKTGDIVNLPGETIKTSAGNFLIKGGEVELESKIYENPEIEIWLVFFTDYRYELSVQRMFFKNSLPQPYTKERIMATKKKKEAKKAVKKSAKKAAKKTAQKVAKKVAKKSAAKKDSSKKVPLSRFVSSLIVEGKFTDEKIVEKTQSEYPKYVHTDLKTVAYYRKFLNEGKMEKAGFDKPKRPYEPIGSKSATKTATKQAKRKVARKKTK